MSENALKRIKSAAPQKFCALPPRAPLLSSNMKITGCNLSKLGMQPAHPATPHPRPLSISRRVTPPLPKSCSVTPKVGDSYRLSRLKEPIQAPLSVRQSFDQNVQNTEPSRASVPRAPAYFSESPNVMTTVLKAPHHVHTHSSGPSRAFSAGNAVLNPAPLHGGGFDPRQIKLRKALIELAPPIVTSKAWSIVNGRTGELLFGKCDQERRQFASLTKIMTFHVVLQYAERKSLDLRALQVTVSKSAARINGTSANVRAGDTFSCFDLLYGMMLPSGNDVALLFAQFFGRLLLAEGEVPGRTFEKRRSVSTTRATKKNAAGSRRASRAAGDSCERTQEQQQALRCVDRFLFEMNSTAGLMGLKMTRFYNPHGLSNNLQKSNPAELGKMTALAMRHPTFRKVCSTRFYSCRPINDQNYTYRWTNTHKMLDVSGYNGVKTGITPAAGPCLATSYQVKDTHLIIILLDSKTMDHRWNETAKLVNWSLSRLKRAALIYSDVDCDHVIRKIKNIQTGSCTRL